MLTGLLNEISNGADQKFEELSITLWMVNVELWGTIFEWVS